MSEAEVKRAEQEVKKSSVELERAFEHLEETVEDGRKKMAHAVETVQKPKRYVENVIFQMKSYWEQSQKIFAYYYFRGSEILKLSYQKIRDSYMNMIQAIRSRPLLLWSSIGVIGMSAFLYYYFRRRVGQYSYEYQISDEDILGSPRNVNEVKVRFIA